MKRSLLIVLLALALPLCAQTVDQCEWFIGADPGLGSGTPISIGAADDSVALAFSVATGSLAPGLHRVNIRCRTSGGVWGKPHARLVTVSPGAAVARLITQCEWKIDNGSPTVVDPADDDSVTLNQIVATGSIPLGLHRYQIRCTDDLGRSGQYHSGFFVVESVLPPVARLVTHLEYWLDSDAPTVLDVTDGASVNFNQMLSTAGVGIGLHKFNLRARDNAGRTGAAHASYLIVSSPFGEAEARTIAGAEIFVNADPGEGNGIPIHLPQDGAFDESEETADTVLTNLPIGLHQIGMRVMDDLGRWSQPVYDSTIVGPVLVVRANGSDIVLDWLSGSGVDEFYIYRANTADGSYALIDSTVAQTYTDVGILNSQLRQFYHVTFRAGSISEFRLPAAAEVVHD